jgi:bifunctional non-homologous end joining protein LigD
MVLAEYARKRNFKATSEPRAIRLRQNGQRRFVIQKHATSRLHYDFRLELGGVLKSWAVPKGMPFTKGEKRLAVQVEDHPVTYMLFEGTIPKGQYGGGTVMVWDTGTFSTAAKSPLKELASGKLHFTLAGKKLKGAWHLVQLRHSDQWLLIKGGDDLKPVSEKADDRSALSGKTMKQLSAGINVWQSKPRGTKPGSSTRHANALPSGKPAADKVKSPKLAKRPALTFVEPMKARLATAPRSGDWFYEIKFDGFRALGLISSGQVSLLSRTEKNLGGKFPEITGALKTIQVEEAIVDGEIVALDDHGVSSFQSLQAYELGEKRPPIYYYVFDLLRLNGEDFRNKPLGERKGRLEQILMDASEVIRYSASLGTNAARLLKQARQLGLEGLIGKRKDSVYEAGRRSGEWIKLKLHHEQEFVIGGFTDPEGSREHFGALLAGFYEKNQLKFCGKVGTGFDRRLLAELSAQFRSLATDQCPFVNLPEKRDGRFGAGVTTAEMKRCHWLSPKLVAQLRFSEWTRDEKLRQPVFLGLRDDKAPDEVVREKAG